MKGHVACALAALLCAPVFVQAKDGVRNLGGGLDEIATPSGAAPAAASVQRRAATLAAPIEEVTHLIQFDDAGRVLVRISLDGAVPLAVVLQDLKATPSVDVVASDTSYRSGVVEAWVPTNSLLNVASSKGVLAVVPTVPYITNVGATTSQGVVQHRVDQLLPASMAPASRSA